MNFQASDFDRAPDRMSYESRITLLRGWLSQRNGGRSLIKPAPSEEADDPKRAIFIAELLKKRKTRC